MAVEIISQGSVCDGYDITIQFDDGEKMVGHSPKHDPTQEEINTILDTLQYIHDNPMPPMGDGVND